MRDRNKNPKREILEARRYGGADLMRLFFRTSPFYALCEIVLTLISAVIPTLTIFATAAFIDSALAAAQSLKSTPAPSAAALLAGLLPVLPSAAALLAFALYTMVAGGIVSDFIAARRNSYVRRTLRPELLRRVAALEYRHIENQDSADLLDRVVPKLMQNVVSGSQNLLSLANVALTAAGVIGTLMTSSWIAGLVMTAAYAPLIPIAIRGGRQQYQTQREVTKLTRRAEYISETLRSREAVEERAVYGYTGALNGKYVESRRAAVNKIAKTSLRIAAQGKLFGIVGSLTAPVVVGALLPAVIAGRADFGMFAALAVGVFRLSDGVMWRVQRAMRSVAMDAEFLADLTKFMALEASPDALEPPITGMTFEKIELRDVSFTYPGTEKKILDGVSLTIERGSHYAFVGVNGAGKTTITKLLTGLYTNYTGEILIDGRELRGLAQKEIKGLSSVVYQDFARYNFSLFDNIAIGAPSSSEADVREAIEVSGLREAVAKLPNGVHTNLGKLYSDGVDISGGEWQRVAIARSLVSRAPLRILDEPTAALDPVAESRVYSQFEEISRGRTTIFISHRLGSTKLADTIFVLADGKIAESGTHRGLMAQNGLYAEMYTAQAEWYAGGSD
ncbi:MAG: ABC transporter ATP-binding protein/permease [Oscillospiraceae bacterium]|jgi:ATP-binding cassette subfamily B protein|nr:ABC transporter ATP-binding protein/permease [Oscillospiraceae bacterium]